MKKLLFILSVVTFALVSCQNDKDYKLDATPKTLSFAATGGAAQTVTVTAENVEWDIELSSELDWINFQKNGDQITITLDDNTTAYRRSGKLTITSDVSSTPEVTIVIAQRSTSDVIFRRAIGDIYGIKDDIMRFDLTLYTSEDETVVEGQKQLFLEILTEPVEEVSDGVQILATGIYTVNDSNNKFTAVAGVESGDNSFEHSFLTIIDDAGNITRKGVSKGTFVVDFKDDLYVMDFAFELSDGTLFYGIYNAHSI